VVQKHDATRLHYDFRLELDGVPEVVGRAEGSVSRSGGQTLEMEVKIIRFRTSTLSHYSRGNYGAGAVMVWDVGTMAAALSAAGKWEICPGNR